MVLFRGFLSRVYFRFRIIAAGMEVIRMAIGYFCKGTIPGQQWPQEIKGKQGADETPKRFRTKYIRNIVFFLFADVSVFLFGRLMICAVNGAKETFGKW